MDIIFFVPIGVILLVLLLFAGGIFQIVKATTQILLMCSIFGFFFLGVRILVKGISFALEEKKPFWAITETIRGIFTAIISLWTFLLFAIGCGHIGPELFHKAKFVLFGTFDKLDFFLVCVLISVISVIVVAVPVLFIDKEASVKQTFIFQSLSVILSVLIMISIYQISMKSEFLNSKDDFIWESPEFIVTQTTPVYHDFSAFKAKTGQFRTGTELYYSDNTRTYNDKKYFEVSDGKQIGYVAEDDLYLLVIHSYYSNADTCIYGYEEKEVSRGDLSVTFANHTDDIVAYITKGTELEIFTRRDGHFVFVKLPDGTLGFIDKQFIQEVRTTK